MDSEIITDKNNKDMALIKCPECDKEISDRAARCPKCGIPMEKIQSLQQRSAMNEISKEKEEHHIQYQQKKRRWLWGLVAIIVLLLAVLAFLLLCDRNGSQSKHPDDVFIENSSRSDGNDRDNNIKNTILSSESSIQNTNIFPNEERIKNLLSDYSHAVVNNDFSTLEKLYAPTVERYHSAYGKGRDYVVDDHRNYDDFFKVYGKHSSLRWETFKTERISDGRVETVIIEDYSLDRMDESKYSIFVLEKHFIINDDYQIVGVWDNQLSKKKKSDQY